MIARKNQSYEYADDIFDKTRMSFGDHIDELRTRMIRAIMWLFLFLVLGFILDAIGEAVGNRNIGIGRPMLDVITDPVESQVRDFDARRNEKAYQEKLKNLNLAEVQEQRLKEIKAKLVDADGNRIGELSDLTSEERDLLLGQSEEMPVVIPAEAFAPVFGPPKEGAPKEIVTKIRVYPAQINYLSKKGEPLLGGKKYLSTLSPQEGMVVWFKVSIICGIVLGSPMILYQFWAFVGAGLYPHEKRYVYVFLWPSLSLFIFGVLLCQFVVLPGAVKALLAFNEFLGLDPDIRLREWLSLALILPLVFGISFQTPVVMVFLNRIGLFTAADYLSKWRYACFILAVLAAVLTPTPDVITMMYMFVPMFGLYIAGILICYYFPGIRKSDVDEPAAEEIAV
jgi:sec-independent protein translocase protein TatC